MTIFAAASNARTFDYQGGDIGYVPASYGTWFELTIHSTPGVLTFDVGHYLENTGNTTLHFLEIFDTGKFPTQHITVFQYHSLFGTWQIVSRISASPRYGKIDLQSSCSCLPWVLVASTHASRTCDPDPRSLCRCGRKIQQD
jgi:hypothetical protein